eukprot:GHVU01058605.1.p3 GENE.GHVU01058605.1~~GHVU01058605.1.p3  ORF type:complete len:106 (+),score=10.35 GHVU01058605.1:822-1139(+)
MHICSRQTTKLTMDAETPSDWYVRIFKDNFDTYIVRRHNLLPYCQTRRELLLVPIHAEYIQHTRSTCNEWKDEGMNELLKSVLSDDQTKNESGDESSENDQIRIH